MRQEDIGVGPGTTSKNIPRDDKTGIVNSPGSRSPYYNYNPGNSPKIASIDQIKKFKPDIYISDDIVELNFKSLEFIKKTILNNLHLYKFYYLINAHEVKLSPYLFSWLEFTNNKNIAIIVKLKNENNRHPLYFISSLKKINLEKYKIIEREASDFKKRLEENNNKIISINLNKNYELDCFVKNLNLLEDVNEQIIFCGRVRKDKKEELYELTNIKVKEIGNLLYFTSHLFMNENTVRWYMRTFYNLFKDNKIMSAYEFLIVNGVLNFQNFFNNFNFLLNEGGKNYNRLDKIFFALDKENLNINPLNIINNRGLREADSGEMSIILVTTDIFRALNPEFKKVFDKRRLLFREDDIKVYVKEKE